MTGTKAQACSRMTSFYFRSRAPSKGVSGPDTADSCLYKSE